ncbi:MAG: thioredoxin family protein [Myxococcota bacterium]
MVEDFDSMEQLEGLMHDGGTAILDFWSTTCGPCRHMAPHFEAVAEQFASEPVRFVRINTGSAPELAAPFRIRSVPTLLFVHDGEILDVRVGALSGAALQKKARWLLRKASGEGLLARFFG